MDLKSKLLLALSSFTSSSSSSSAITTSAISSAIRRATNPRDTSIDDDPVHNLLFLVSNSPSSSTFLAHRLSARLLDHPVTSLKALLLLHRLLRGAHRRFELDIRDLHSSGNLRLHIPHHLHSPFLHHYAGFISERTNWAIDQSGHLEPLGPPPVPCRTSNPTAFAIWKLSRSQDFLDRVIDAGGRKPTAGFIRPENRVGWDALRVVLKESFRVYTTFADGVDLVVSSLANPTSRTDDRSDVGAVRQIITRSSSQSSMLSEFYEACKRVIGCKTMDFPNVRIVTEEDILVEEKLLSSRRPRPSWDTTVVSGVEGGGKWKLETRISTEWVKF